MQTKGPIAPSLLGSPMGSLAQRTSDSAIPACLKEQPLCLDAVETIPRYWPAPGGAASRSERRLVVPTEQTGVWTESRV
jgi:hypothetical protein